MARRRTNLFNTTKSPTQNVPLHGSCQTSDHTSAYLRVEMFAFLGGVVLRVGGDESTADFLDGDVLDVEADVVAGQRLRQRLVVHLHGLDLRAADTSTDGAEEEMETE